MYHRPLEFIFIHSCISFSASSTSFPHLRIIHNKLFKVFDPMDLNGGCIVLFPLKLYYPLDGLVPGRCSLATAYGYRSFVGRDDVMYEQARRLWRAARRASDACPISLFGSCRSLNTN